MNPLPTETATHALDPNLVTVIVQATLDAIPHHPGATQDEQDAGRQAAFTLLNSYHPRDPQEAMLAARIAATQFHIMDDLRCAAQPDLPSALKLRHRRSAATLTRMQHDAHRELTRRQAYPAQNPATLSAAVPARRPLPAPAAAPRPAPGSFIPPTAAEIERLVTQVEANLDAQPAVAPRRARHDDPAPTDAEADQRAATSHALFAGARPAAGGLRRAAHGRGRPPRRRRRAAPSITGSKQPHAPERRGSRPRAAERYHPHNLRKNASAKRSTAS
jgi:hypothetical protein